MTEPAFQRGGIAEGAAGRARLLFRSSSTDFAACADDECSTYQSWSYGSTMAGGRLHLLGDFVTRALWLEFLYLDSGGPYPTLGRCTDEACLAVVTDRSINVPARAAEMVRNDYGFPTVVAATTSDGVWVYHCTSQSCSTLDSAKVDSADASVISVAARYGQSPLIAFNDDGNLVTLKCGTAACDGSNVRTTHPTGSFTNAKILFGVDWPAWRIGSARYGWAWPRPTFLRSSSAGHQGSFNTWTARVPRARRSLDP